MPKITGLFLVLLLTVGSIGKAETLSRLHSDHNSEEKASIDQANNPNLFAIHHEKTGVNLLETLPESNSAESQNYLFRLQPAETALQKWAAIYLQFCSTIDCSLPVKKLIFPFHSHW